MLKRIEVVKGIGLLHDAKGGAPHELHKATFVYAENGRGKSTFTSVLRACSTGDAASVLERRTVDGTNQPEVRLQFENGVKVNFTNDAWQASRPEILVFDADFVEQNVYSGAQVSPDQRRGLLEFALGAQAVVARRNVDAAVESARVATVTLDGIEGKLSGFHRGVSLADFAVIEPILDADQQIEGLQKRISAAQRNITLQRMTTPSAVAEPVVNLEEIFSIFETTLKDIEIEAEQTVRIHTDKHGGAAAESWISHGLALESDNSCPYCGQSLQGNELVRAYRTYFNVAYNQLKQRVSEITRRIDLSFSEQIIEQFGASVGTTQAIMDGWSEHVELSKLIFNKEDARIPLNKLREMLLGLALRKEQTPLEVVGTPEDKAIAIALWQSVLMGMKTCNQAIAIATFEVNKFKAKLASENIQQMQQQIAGLQLAQKRHHVDAVSLISQWSEAKINKGKAEKEKITQREILDALMNATLDRYQVEINKLLQSFGADFEIVQLTSNYYGGQARTDYGLRIRGKNVQLTGGSPSFGTALSEGDKRTLAFAFFVASLFTDSDIESRIVVIDDPMCSLDRNRRQQTIYVLRKLRNSAQQLLVLAHDPYFLRDLRDDFVRNNDQQPVQIIKLGRVQGNYTDFSRFDLDQECETAYYYHHRILGDFVDGSYTGDSRAVAKAIRLMLEGYLHRRFPRRIKRGVVFGEIVQQIKTAQAPNPLTHIQHLTVELNDINGYAGQFHHDVNGTAADTVPVGDAELKSWAQRALNVVFTNAI